MLHESLADRAWLAYQCLPRDPATGALPSYRTLANAFDLTSPVICRVFAGDRQSPSHDTIVKLAAALRVNPKWLADGIGKGPTPRFGVHVLARPGSDWTPCYSEIDDWAGAVKEALEVPEYCAVIPPEAYAAGGDLPIFRHVPRITAQLAFSISAYAWETSTAAQQTRYSTNLGWASSVGGRAEHLKPAAKKA